MSVITHEIPLLEYDDGQGAVIMPDHERLELHLPKKAVLAFLDDRVDRYAQEHACPVLGKFKTITKRFPIYGVNCGGQEICLCQAPLGAPAAVQLMDWLIGYGVKQVVAVGSCGALENIPENTFLVPVRALREEGTSYHYLPPARFVDTSEKVRVAIREALRDNGLHIHECITWTTDGFYRETREKVERRKAEGCAVVEMECAALAACAQFRQTDFGQMLFTADSLADTERYQERGWGRDSHELALRLALEAAARMK